jgi:predicted phage-related endonuclease
MGTSPPKDSTLPMRAGSYMEPFLRDEFANTDDYLEKDLQTCNEQIGMIRHKEYPFIFANVDDIGVSKFGSCVIEYKTSSGMAAYNGWKKGDYPQTYYAQVQLYMEVLGSYFPGEPAFDHAFIVALLNNNKIEVRFVQKDQDWLDMAIQKARDFWDAVEKKDTSEFIFCVDGKTATLKAISKVFPGERENEKELSKDANLTLMKLEAATDTQRAAEAEVNRLKSTLLLEMKDATRASTDMYRVSWPVNDTRKIFDKGAFLEANPGVDLDQFQKQLDPYRMGLKVKRV